jgi:tetratricopeptide (TPR) repeat protein
MSQCPNCKEALPDGAKFCSNCGASVAEANSCPHCGGVLKPAAKFCHHCGQTIGEAAASSRSAAAHDDGGAAVEAPENASPTSRSWKTTLLPLIGIPVLVGIIFLLTYKQQNPQPISSSAGMPQAEADGAGADMASMENVFQQIEKYKSDLQANPKDTTALLALGSMYEIANRFEETADYYRRYLEVVPDNVQVRMNLAGVYYNNQQRQQALNELQQLLKHRPNYDYAMYNMGVIYLAEGKKDEAIKWWHKVIETTPSSELAHNAREQIKTASGQ